LIVGDAAGKARLYASVDAVCALARSKTGTILRADAAGAGAAARARQEVNSQPKQRLAVEEDTRVRGLALPRL